MREITFIQNNRSRWQTFEQKVDKPRQMEPDELAGHFIQLTDDLSYARTFYPESSVVQYLNTLSGKAWQIIYQNKKEKSNRLLSFWSHELPLALYQARGAFFMSFIIFIISMAIGMVSVLENDSFVRLVLGDQYVNTTLDNIERGDPLAVYGQMEPVVMFLLITGNNIFVAFVVFLFGLFTPLGTAFHLFRNGLMVGAFQAFFYKQSLLSVFSLTVFLHGTLELSAIVLAGGAGIVLGRSILFAGTWPRKTAFVKGVRRGTMIMVGLVPFFIVAGFIESFITRYYNQMPMVVSLLIIFLSLMLIIGYFVVYPVYVHRNRHQESGNRHQGTQNSKTGTRNSELANHNPEHVLA